MKIAACVQQIMLIVKEIEIDETKPLEPQLQIPILPTDRPAVKQIIDVFDEDGNLLASYGRGLIEDDD